MPSSSVGALRKYLGSALKSHCNTYGPTPSVDAFRIFLNAHAEIGSRQNLEGHLTGSAIVWHETSDTILRVHHAKLDKWVFSAGGHINEGEMPWQASARELYEEVGITALPLYDDLSPVPFIIDVQAISHSPTKGEPAHCHYDIIYLYSVSHRPEIRPDPKEVKDYRWVPVDEVTLANAPVNLQQQFLAYRA